MTSEDKELLKCIYWNKGLTTSTNVVKEEKYVLTLIEELHYEAKDNFILTNDEYNEYITSKSEEIKEKIEQKIKDKKANEAPYILASAFGQISQPNTPQIAPRKIKNNGGVLRDFICIDYDLEDEKELKKLIEKTNEILKPSYQYALYPSTSYPLKPRARLVIPVNKLLNNRSYKRYANLMIQLIGVDPLDNSNERISHTFNGPYYLSEAAYNADFTIIKKDGKILNINDLIKNQKQEIQIRKYDNTLESLNLPKEKKINITKELIEELDDYEKFWRFAESLALANINNQLSDQDVEDILIEVASGNEKWERDNLNVYQNQKNKLQNNPDIKKIVKPIEEYIPSLKPKQKKKKFDNLIQWLIYRLSPAEYKNSEMEMSTLITVLSKHIEFALLKNYSKDTDALAMFNPLTGLWTKDDNILIALASQIINTLTQTQFNTLKMMLAANARTQNKFIDPYSGSQYIVFKNGVLDITTMELLELDSEKVKSLKFTNRHLINIDYEDNPKLIIYENDGINNNSWSIDQFINAYAGNDKDRRTYFLFGLSLGLFAGHNTGVHFDIQGPSGSGKSTLSLIFKGLYSTHRVPEILFSNLNEKFPITSYPDDAAVIWIKECNTSVSPLSEDKGTPFYDSLADGSARLPLKHADDLILENPPQVYIDGTRLIHSEDIWTGPARRTLAFKLPDNIEELRPQFYSNHISERLQDPKNLIYLVHECIKAFKEIVPKERQTNFKMNLGVKEDLELLPPIAQEWRREFMSADSNLIEWYDEEIEPYLAINNKEALFTDNFFYRMYLSWYKRINPNDSFQKYAKSFDRFAQDLRGVFIDKGLFKIYIVEQNGRKRKRITNPETWGFNWTDYKDMYVIPFEFRSSNNWSEVYGKRVANVYYLTNKQPDPKMYKRDKKDPIGYLPNRK